MICFLFYFCLWENNAFFLVCLIVACIQTVTRPLRILLKSVQSRSDKK